MPSEIWPVQAGDCYLLCSDGLSNYVDEGDLSRVLSSNFYCDVPRLLVGLANDRGGDDNITVVLIHVANDGEDDRKGGGEGRRAGDGSA